ncbi:MAG: hypothetical protein V4606_01030 [Patescibacteria group bacterium]
MEKFLWFIVAAESAYIIYLHFSEFVDRAEKNALNVPATFKSRRTVEQPSDPMPDATHPQVYPLSHRAGTGDTMVVKNARTSEQNMYDASRGD